jgi:hypothetical protein
MTLQDSWWDKSKPSDKICLPYPTYLSAGIAAQDFSFFKFFKHEGVLNYLFIMQEVFPKI